MLYLYYVFIEEDTFYSDGFESFLIFPEYLRYFEAHPEFTEEFKYNVMWCFKMDSRLSRRILADIPFTAV